MGNTFTYLWDLIYSLWFACFNALDGVIASFGDNVAYLSTTVINVRLLSDNAIFSMPLIYIFSITMSILTAVFILRLMIAVVRLPFKIVGGSIK